MSIFSFLISFGYSQNGIFSGKVVLINSGRTTVVDAKVSGYVIKSNGIKEHANSRRTNKKGGFELEFSNEWVDHQVHLEVISKNKDTFQIVKNINNESFRMPDKSKFRRFEVLVVTLTNLEKATFQYYNTLYESLLNEKEKLEGRVKQLTNDQFKQEHVIQKLNSRIDQLTEKLDSAKVYEEAYRLAQLNEDDLGPRMQNFLNAIKNGKEVQDALTFLNRELTLKEGKKDFRDIHSKILELNEIANWNAVLFNFEEVIACYEDIIELLEGSPIQIAPSEIAKWYSNASYYLAMNDKLLSAQTYYVKANEIDADLFGTEKNKALFYHNMATMNSLARNYNDALVYIDQSIQIREPLNDDYLASSYGIKSEILRLKGNCLESRKFSSLSVELLRGDSSEIRNLGISLGMLGRSEACLGNHEYSLELMSEGVLILQNELDSLDPQLATAYEGLANSFEFVGNFQSAKVNHKKALVIRESIFDLGHSDLTASYNNVALNYHDLGDYDSSMIYMEKYRLSMESKHDRLDTAWLRYYENLGSINIEFKKYAAASESILEVLKLTKVHFGSTSTRFADVLQVRGIFYLLLPQPDSSIFYLEAAATILANNYPVECSKQLLEIYHDLMVLYDAPPIEDKSMSLNYQFKRLNILETHFADTTEIPLQYGSISRAFYNTNQIDSAIYYCKKALNIKTEDFDSTLHYQLYLNLSYLYIENKKSSSAMRYYKKFHEVVRNKVVSDSIETVISRASFNVYSGCGNIKYNTGKFKKAIRFYENSISFEENAKIYNKLGICYFHTGEYDSAIKSYSRASELNTIDAPYYYSNLAQIYLRKNDLDSAKFFLVKAEPLQKKDFGYYLNLGVYYYKTGDNLKSEECFKMATVMEADMEYIARKDKDIRRAFRGLGFNPIEFLQSL